MKFKLPADFEEYYYGSYEDSPAGEVIANLNKLPDHLQQKLIAYLADTAPIDEQSIFDAHLEAMDRAERISLIHRLLDTL